MSQAMLASDPNIQHWKQRLVQVFIRSLKLLLGNDSALDVMKALVRKLPPKVAFPITWVCLWEFPVGTVSEQKWLYGRPRQYPEQQVRVNPNCLSGRFFATSGFYEELLTSEILADRRRGLLVDIGANYGYYPVLWLNKPDTRAITVEPISEYVQLLQENLKEFSSRCQIVQVCIGDYDGTALMDTGGDPTMLSRVVTEDTEGRARSVPMMTLATLLEKYQESHIDVLKIDAEGYDIKILNTCRSLFAAHTITTVFWETANSAAEQEFIEFLQQVGYAPILEGYVTGYEVSE